MNPPHRTSPRPDPPPQKKMFLNFHKNFNSSSTSTLTPPPPTRPLSPPLPPPIFFLNFHKNFNSSTRPPPPPRLTGVKLTHPQRRITQSCRALRLPAEFTFAAYPVWEQVPPPLRGFRSDNAKILNNINFKYIRLSRQREKKQHSSCKYTF